MEEYILNKIQEKYPKRVDFLEKKSTRTKKVFAIRTSEDRISLFNDIKQFLSTLSGYHVIEKMDIGISKSVPLLVVREKNNIDYAFVAKPFFSARASSGSITQSRLSKFMTDVLGLKVTSTAGLSQRIQDLTFEINGVKEGMEIKGTTNFSQKIATFDKSVARSGLGLTTRTDDTPIQEVIKALMEENNIPLSGSSNPFTQYIDFIRKTDKTIGFPGDPGVATAGGKLNDRYFTTSNNRTLTKIISVIKKHFEENNDNYFVIYDTPTNKFFINYTGVGTSNLKTLPIGNKISNLDNNTVASAGIGLYGTLGQKGRIRVAIYLKFNSSVINANMFKYEL